MTGMNAMLANTELGLSNPLAGASFASLSWNREEGERLRLTVITLVALMLFVPLALLIPTLDVQAPEREQAESIPPQLAKLTVKPEVIEKATPKPAEDAAPPKPKPPEPKPPEPKPAKPEPVRPAPQPQVAKPTLKPVPAKEAQKPASQNVEQARENASRSGLLTMKDRLASMRQPSAEPAPVIKANTGDTIDAANGVKTQVAKDALQGSGGVKEVQSTTRADVEVAGHQVRKIEAPTQAQSVVASAPAPAQKPAVGERAMSNIRQVFDSGKAALYSLYQRELRKDPTLAGKVLLELVIEPDGTVSACKVVSSELESPVLEQKIAMRVRLFSFGADNVEARKLRFPIDFLPG
ncbi:MAG: AgmX/PglI C-terminal domain-containing protein [Marinobacter sp.]